MTVDPGDELLAPEVWEMDDHTIKFPDYISGDWITLGSTDEFCSVQMEGLGSPELRTNEIEMSGQDGITFGREYLGARRWTISGVIKSGAKNAYGDAGTAWDSLAKLQRAWDYNPATYFDPANPAQYQLAWNYAPMRTNARQVIPLLWQRPSSAVDIDTGLRERSSVLLYGRPERIDADTTNAYAGFISYTAVFRQSDPKFYSAEEYSIGVTLIAPYSGGLQLTSSQDALFATDGALRTSQGTEVRVTTEVTGDLPTNPVIIFHGPVSFPKLQVLNPYGGVLWEISVNAAITDTQSITVDTRPWRQTVTRNDGVNLAGFLRSTRMKDILLPVGENEIVYTGSDTTNTSYCEVKYRNAWASV